MRKYRLPAHKFNNASSAYSIIIMILSAFYAWSLSSLPNEFFRDRQEYIYYALDSSSIMDSYSGISYYFNEPFFLHYNIALENVIAPELVPKIGVFFISFTILYLILKNAHNLMSALVACLLLLFVSFTFHLQLVILRQGISTALFLWIVYYFWGKKTFYPLCFSLAFFHISFLIVFFILILDYISSIFFKNVRYRISFIAVTMTVLSTVMLTLASSLGVRQASSQHLLVNDNGIGGFLLFSFLCIFLYFTGFNNVYNNKYGRISLLGIVAYLSFYYTVPISGRLISTFLPFTYIYLASSNNLKVLLSCTIFLIVNTFLFIDSISNNSLTFAGVQYLNNLLF